jgi:preprotein translocase subunit SecY
MDRFFKLKAYVQNKEIVQRVLFTLGALLVFRLLAKVPVPGVEPDALKNLFGGADSGFFNIANILAGGTLTQFSIISVGIFAYISASIIFQLLGPVVPKIDQLQKMGEVGRKIINQYTRILTVPLAAFQAFGIYLLLKSPVASSTGAIIDPLPVFRIVSLIFVLVAGTMLLVWISELISEYGLGGKTGGGVSVIVTAGILASLPSSIAQAFSQVSTSNFLRNFWVAFGVETLIFLALFVFVVGLFKLGKVLFKTKNRALTVLYSLLYVAFITALPAFIIYVLNVDSGLAANVKTVWNSYAGRLEEVETRFGFYVGMTLQMIAVITFFNESYRKIPIKFVSRIRSNMKATADSTSFLPIKILSPGVMPIIFASSMLLLPQVIYRFFGSQIERKFQNLGATLKFASEGWLNQQTSTYYQILHFVLIVLFGLFYITIIMKPEDVADSLRYRKSFIPGVRPGNDTINYLTDVILKVTFWGGLVLGVISILPFILGIYNSQVSSGIESFVAGGTSILIVVPTILAVKMQLDALVLTKNYESFEEI